MKQGAVKAYDDQGGSSHGLWVKIAVWCMILAVVSWLISQNDMTVYLQPTRLTEFFQDFGVMAPVAFVGIMALAVVVSPIPSLPLDLAAGAVFGPWFGTLYAVLGAEIGAIMSFMIGRKLGREVIARILKSDVVFCEKCSDHHLMGFVFLSRLLPVFSFDLVSYGAGLTTMSLKAFAMATLAGMIPPTFALVYFGSSTITADWLVFLLGLVLVVLIIVLPKLIMRNQSVWWVRMMLGKKPDVSSEPLPVSLSSTSSQCSWCGAKE